MHAILAVALSHRSPILRVGFCDFRPISCFISESSYSNKVKHKHYQVVAVH